MSLIASVKIVFLCGYFQGFSALSYSMFKVNNKQSKEVTKQNAAVTTVTASYPLMVGFNISLLKEKR